MDGILQILVFILIVALGVSLGFWFSHHIMVDVRTDGNGGGGYGPPACQ